MMSNINVTSEIAKLKKVLIHSPGGEMNNMLPSLRLEWLFEDTVHTQEMQNEYKYYTRLLLLFMGHMDLLFNNENKFNFNSVEDNPEDPNYFGKIFLKNKNKELKDLNVLEIQFILAEKLRNKENYQKTRELIIAICAFHKLYINRRNDLLDLLDHVNEDKKAFRTEDGKSIEIDLYMEIAKTLISGKLEWGFNKGEILDLTNNGSNTKSIDESRYIFEPIPNLIFTRDIGVTIKDYLLITKPKYSVRFRETMLLRFIAENFLYTSEDSRKKIIEISEDDDFFQFEKTEREKYAVNIEGGDIMMISPKHILIGNSERTTNYAVQKFIHRMFMDDTGIELISVIKIAEDRAQIHLDTILTQVKENVWMLHWLLSENKDEEEYKDYNLAYSHLDSITSKNRYERKKNKPICISQFYCKKGQYNKEKMYENDFYIYTKEELVEIGSLLTGEEKKRFETEINKKQTYEKLRTENPINFKYDKPLGIEHLLQQISYYDILYKNKSIEEIEKMKQDSTIDMVNFIYSGDKKFPHTEREQWADACNLLCIGKGVVIGYDRNFVTAKAFENCMRASKGETILTDTAAIDDFHYVLYATKLFNDLKDKNKTEVQDYISKLEDKLILLPSAELSRARGGSHCMSMPLNRE